MEYKLIIENKEHYVDEKWKMFILKTIKQGLKKQNKYFIYAVQTGRRITLVNLIYENKEQVFKIKKELEQEGLQVYYEV